MVLPTDIAGNEKKGLFGAKKREVVMQGPSPELMSDIASVTRRLRVMEEQYTNIRRRITVLDHNMLSHAKKLKDEIKVFNSEVIELRKMIEEMDNKMMLIIKELRVSAKKEEVEVLKKYINLWEPVNFVTRNEVTRIVEDVLDEREEKKG